MKNFGIILLIFLVPLIMHAQGTSHFRKPATEKSIPKIVLFTFNSEYGDALVYNWYITHIIYYYEDYSSAWYSNWYGARPVVVYTYKEPAYYEVEFTQEPGETSRAIYNRYGYWFETRTKLAGLPAVVVQALKASKYADWNWSVHMERIEAPGMPESIYRLRISKGMRSIIIRIDDEGNFIQMKELGSIDDGYKEYESKTQKSKNKSKNK